MFIGGFFSHPIIPTVAIETWRRDRILLGNVLSVELLDDGDESLVAAASNLTAFRSSECIEW